MDPKRWRLDGQLALVTGGSAGIGRAIARELLGFGADVLLAARDATGLETARAELLEDFPERDINIFVADVADEEQRRELLDWVEDFGEGLHILVNNAGGNATKPATDYTEDEWRQIFEINLFSAFELSRYAYPLLTKHAASSIVNVGSVSGFTHVRSGANCSTGSRTLAKGCTSWSTTPAATSPSRRPTTPRTSGGRSSRSTCSPRSSCRATPIRC